MNLSEPAIVTTSRGATGGKSTKGAACRSSPVKRGYRTSWCWHQNLGTRLWLICSSNLWNIVCRPRASFSSEPVACKNRRIN